MALSKFGDGISANSSTVTMPASVQYGDIAVMCDNMRASSPGPTTIVPSGFTQFGSTLTVTNVTTVAKRVLSYKVLDGSEGGASISGMSAPNGAKSIVVFRSSVAGTWSAPADVAEALTNSDPSDQTINVGTAPLVCLAWYESSAAVSPRSFSPSEDAEITVASPTSYLKYKIYESSPSDTTVGMDDEGFYNHLSSCYIAFTSSGSEGAGTGTGSAAAVGGAFVARAGASTGAGDGIAIGQANAAAVCTATGNGLTTGIGTGIRPADGAALGEGSAAGTGDSLSAAAAVGDVTGTGTADGAGTGILPGVGSATGAGSVSAVIDSFGVAVGTGTATGNGGGIRPAAASASGAGTADAVSNYTQSVFGVAFSSGTGTSTGVAQYTANSAGAASGSGNALAIVFGWVPVASNSDNVWTEQETAGDIWTKQTPADVTWSNQAA